MSKKWKAWTKEDEKELKTLIDQGKSYKEIAKTINRTVATVRQRTSMLGLSKNKKWSKQEDEILKKMYKAGKSYKEMAESLDRTFSSINYRIALLRLQKRGASSKSWSKSEEEMLVRMYKGGAKREEIAEILNRTYGSVNSRLALIKNRKTPKKRKRKKKEPVESIPEIKQMEENLEVGKEYAVSRGSTWNKSLNRRTVSKLKYKGSTKHLFIFESNNYVETFRKLDLMNNDLEIKI